MNRKLKLTLIILLIVLVSIISFVGLFVQNTKFMDNILPDYKLGMDLYGHRAISVAVSDQKETVYYDDEGKEVSADTEGATEKEVPVNSEESLTQENYLKTRKLVEERFADLNASDYIIRMNENNGLITVYLPEDDMTDLTAQYIYSKGEFTIENEDGQVLMDNSNLKDVKVGYATNTTGTSVYLSFEFNDDAVEKLKEISNTYVESEDEEGNDTSKQVIIKVDGSTLIQTTFEEEIANGVLPLTLGTATDNETLNQYIESASNIAILLNNGPLPLEYNVEQNRFIKSDITMDTLKIPAIVAIAILIIALLFLCVKYKKLGVLSALAFVGYLAVVLIIIRATGLVLTIEGICAIIVSAILGFAFMVYLAHILSKQEKELVQYRKAYKKSMLSMLMVLIPALIIGIVLVFASWLPAYSFGAIMFWSILIMLLYNASITRILLLNSIKENRV